MARMNPLLARLHPYPFERWRTLSAGVVPSPGTPPDQPGHRRAASRHAALIEQALIAGLSGLSSYPATAGDAAAARGDRRLGAAPLRRHARCRHAGAAGQRLARGAVRAGADRDRPDPARRHGRLPQSVLSDLRRRGAAGRCADRITPTATRPAISRSTGRSVDAADLGPHAAAVCLLAGQPDRRGDAAGRVEACCSSCRDRHGFVIASDECYSEIYFRDEAAAGRPARRPRGWAATTSGTWSPSPACPSAATCPACAAASWPATRRSSSTSCSTAPTTAAR